MFPVKNVANTFIYFGNLLETRRTSLTISKYLVNVVNDLQIGLNQPESVHVELRLANPGIREHLAESGDISLHHHASANNTYHCAMKFERREVVEGSLQP